MVGTVKHRVRLLIRPYFPSSISNDNNHSSSIQLQTMIAVTTTTTTICNNFIDNEFIKGSIDATSYILVLNPCNGNEIELKER